MARDEPRLLTTREAAERLTISHKTLQRYVAEGKVRPTLRLPGGQMRWSLDHLKAQIRAMDPTEQGDDPEDE